AGFDQLIALRPQEIQVGILKRLRGTPIVRHDVTWAMHYDEHPPYEVLRTKLMDAPTMKQLRRFARFWDLIGNSGNFARTTPMIWRNAESPFREFMNLCEWLYRRFGRQHGIPLVELAEGLFDYLTNEKGLEKRELAEAMLADYQSGG